MEIRRIPYHYTKARFLHSKDDGYRVTLYFLFDGKTTYTFLHQSDWLDNGSLANEIDSKHIFAFHQEILVTKDKFPEIYQEIKDFENNVP